MPENFFVQGVIDSYSIRAHAILFHVHVANIYKWKTVVYSYADCHRKNGPGKNGPAGPILGEKIIQPDHFGQLKMVRPDHFWKLKVVRAG